MMIGEYTSRRARVMRVHRWFLNIIKRFVSADTQLALLGYIREHVDTDLIKWRDYKLYLAFFGVCLEHCKDNEQTKIFIANCWPDIAHSVCVCQNVKHWVQDDVIRITHISNPVEQSRELQQFLKKIEVM